MKSDFQTFDRYNTRLRPGDKVMVISPMKEAPLPDPFEQVLRELIRSEIEENRSGKQ